MKNPLSIPDTDVVDLSQAEPTSSFETAYSVYGDSLECAFLAPTLSVVRAAKLPERAKHE